MRVHTKTCGYASSHKDVIMRVHTERNRVLTLVADIADGVSLPKKNTHHST